MRQPMRNSRLKKTCNRNNGRRNLPAQSKRTAKIDSPSQSKPKP